MASRKTSTKPKPDEAPLPPPDPMAEKFEAAILENPDEDAAYLVYADYLMAKGDPRGELIVLQHDADEAEGPRKRQLKKAADALLDQHAAYFLGPLAAIAGGTFTAIWRYGFVRRLSIAWNDLGWSTYEHKALETLATVLQHPSTRFVIDLQVGCIYDEDFEDDIQSVIDTLVKLQRPAPLRWLDLSVRRASRVDSDYCEVAPLIKAFSRLERIRLRERSRDQPRPDDEVHEMMIERSRPKKRAPSAPAE